MCKLKPLLQKWLQFAVKGNKGVILRVPYYDLCGKKYREYGALENNFYHLWKFKKHKDPVLDQTNGFSALEKAANSGRKRKKRPSHEVKS